MDNLKIPVEEFEKLLQKQSCRYPSDLYNEVHNSNEQTYKPQHVIETVCSQIKAICLADTFKNVKRRPKTLKNINAVKISNFLPVNKLPVYHEVSENNNNIFDNPCVSDTQLMNIIEGADVIDTQTGIAQEFETTFTHIEENANVENKETCQHNFNKNDTQKVVSALNDTVNVDYSRKGIIVTQDLNTIEVLNRLENMDINAEQNTQRSPSPVLNMKARKIKLPTLTVSLATFENFENIAMSLIEENTDLDTVKRLILSQILEKELHLNRNTDVMFGERNYSPIYELKRNELKVNSQDLKTPIVQQISDNVVGLHDTNNVTDAYSESLKDEILFSSDEDNEYIHTEFQDLPLTPLLRTSFSEESVVLEETMNVGFQTASNKPIKVFTDSFSKARSFRYDNDGTDKEFSLNKFMEKCDIINSKNENIVTLANKVIETNDTDMKSRSEYEDTNKVLQEKQVFKGFRTASFKKINMSDEALNRCQKVFKDIDLDKNFDAIEDIENKEPAVESKVCSYDNDMKEECEKNLQDNTIDDKINDELLLQEFENIEMALKEKETNIEEKKVVYEGFKTANNKNIKISDEAIAKTKNIFQNIDTNLDEHKSDVDFNQPSTSGTVFMGFKTGNNEGIKISDDALSKSKSVFKDINKDYLEMEIIENFDEPSTSKGVLVGFKTASNKDIKISNDALSKSNIIFKDINEEIPAQSTVEEKEPAFGGFTNANNTAVTVSANAFPRSLKMFQDDDHVMIPSKAARNVEIDKDDSQISKGFQMASKKAVIISADAYARRKRIFQNADEDDEIIPRKITRHLEIDKVENQIEGFQTASRKPVKVSENALALSKRTFQNIDEDDENIDRITKKKKIIGFQGFKTSNSKSVDLSKEAIIASKQLLTYSNAEANAGSNFVGFKTASNKDVNISEEAFAKSKKLFDEIDDKHITAPMMLNFPVNKPTDNIFKGFQTANHKEVEISREALEITNLFHDIDSSTENENKVVMRGFETANNDKITVSEEEIAKSKNLIHAMDTENDFNINNNIAYNEVTAKVEETRLTKSNFRVKTCINKRITISEDALHKSKKLSAQETVPDKDKNTSTLESKKVTSKDSGIKKTGVNVEGILNTQVLTNFDENLCTEDFEDTPRPNKRSCSPILPCPRAKKRKKFETPYKSDPKTVIDSKKVVGEAKKPASVITFKADYKKNKKYTLQDLARFENDSNKSIDPYILSFNLENILNFEFDGVRNDLKEGKINIEELKQYFVEVSDKKLIPEGWMNIQLKLIIWKLISYEIKFPNALRKVCTIKNVLHQLKYRYDKELYNAERPVLRKILEKDDVPSKAMCLCVAGIYIDGVSVTSAAKLTNIELLLTDGWYTVKATIDKMLSKLVYDGKIVVGRKILTCGAELVNCEQGVAPWEDTSAVRLNISGNSTKPARWWTRLGRHHATISCHLSDVNVDGGKAVRLRARVARVYPTLYVERLPDGSTVTRSERLEHQYQMKYETEREVMVERVYEEVEKEFRDQATPDSESSQSSSKMNYYESGSQIAQLMKHSKDPMEFRAQLTTSQIQLLQDHASKQRDRYLQAVQDRINDTLRPRNVVTLARGRVADVDEAGGRVIITRGMLSVWKPNDAVLDIFKENAWIEVTNVVPTAVRNSEIQLSAGRQSTFRKIKCKEGDIIKPHLESLKRICHTVEYLSQNPSKPTDYNEIDTVGIIFSIDPPNRDFESIQSQFQNVYLADIDKNMISVNFWGGIKKFGFENVLVTGQVVYCGNLQKRAGNTRKNIPQYRATEFSLFTKTPKNETAREMVEEISKKMIGLDSKKFCDDCVAVKLNYSAIRCFNDSENVSPYIFDNSNYNLAKHRMFIETPAGVTVNKEKAADFSLTGLDFESTFKQESTQELSPKTLLRKNKIKEKIARLKMYGEPPPLSPINIINKSKNAASSFISPLICKNDDAAPPSDAPSVTSAINIQNVAATIKLPDVCGTPDGIEANVYSPIFSTDRTYVQRRSMKPVKLNFSKNIISDEDADRTVDRFADEIDGSPPLSLE